MELTPEEIAAQLRKPEGDAGIQIGDFMHKGNANFYRQLFSHLDWKPGMKVLEVGIGTGKHISELLSQAECIDYTGLDYSQFLVDYCSKQYPEQDFVCQDIQEINLPEQQFDLIFSINTVYFIEDLEAAFKGLKSILSENGKIYIGKRPKEDMEKLSGITQYNFIKYSNEEVVTAIMSQGLDVETVLSFKDPQTETNHKNIQLHSDYIIAKHGN